jgi:hypothetical protein
MHYILCFLSGLSILRPRTSYCCLTFLFLHYVLFVLWRCTCTWLSLINILVLILVRWLRYLLLDLNLQFLISFWHHYVCLSKGDLKRRSCCFHKVIRNIVIVGGNIQKEQGTTTARMFRCDSGRPRIMWFVILWWIRIPHVLLPAVSFAIEIWNCWRPIWITNWWASIPF